MARKKGVSKTRNAGRRKTVTETSQTSKEDNRLKDDPGGKISNNMDESKLISEKVQTYNRQDHHYNQLNCQNSSPIELNHSNNKNLNLNKQYKNHRNTVFDDKKKSTTIDKTKLQQQKIDNNKDYQNICDNVNNNDDDDNDIENANGAIISPTEYKNASTTNNNIINNNGSSSSNSNNNINNNNINNNNHNHNSNKNVSSSSLSTTISSSTNDLKYLHKKFKRIASATTSIATTDERQTTQNHNNNIIDNNFSGIQKNQNEINNKTILLSKSKDIITNHNTNSNQQEQTQPQQQQQQQQQQKYHYILLNGNAQLSTTVPSLSPPQQQQQVHQQVDSRDSNKMIITQQNDKKSLNNDINNRNNSNNNKNINNREGQTIYLNNFRINSQSANQTNININNNNATTKLSTKLDDKTFIASSSNITTSKIDNTLNSSSSCSTTTINSNHNNSNNNILNRFTNNDNNSTIDGGVVINQNQKVLPSTTIQQQSSQQQQQRLLQQRDVLDQNLTGRHVCPYCNLNCAKPSVLQKHIRAHTNERPYPCDTCSFAFKTKSNYYKHCRSRSHALRMKGIEIQPDDDGSVGSDQDQDLSNSSSDVISRTASPMDERVLTPAIIQQTQIINQQQNIQKYTNEKPYKPKFHNAALYAKEEHQHQQQQKHNHNNNHHYHHHHNHHHQQQQQQQNHSISNQPNQQLQQVYFTQTTHFPPSQQNQQQTTTEQETYLKQYQSIRGRIVDQTITVPITTTSTTSIPPPPPPSPLTTTHQFQQVVVPSSAPYNNESTVSQFRESTGSVFSGSTTTSTSSSGNGNGSGHQLNVEFLQEHISKIISQNEAIVENKELLLQKKYPKITGKLKNSSLVMSEGSNSKLAFVLSNKLHQQQHQQPSQSLQRDESSSSNNRTTANSSPVILTSTNTSKIIHQNMNFQQHPQETVSPSLPLNLTKINEQQEIVSRKRSLGNENFLVPQTTELISTGVSSSSKTLATHPQNPERSIIKHLLLNARGLGVPNGEGEDAVYTCPLCKLEFRSADDLRLHTSSYCQGGPSSAPISPVASPSFKYFRSNSINVNLPEFNNPNSLAKLARSSLIHLSKNPLSLAKLAWSQLKTKPSNLVLNQLNINTNTNTTAASGTSSSGQSSINPSTSIQKLIDAPLPSPGPLLGKTPLVEAYNNSEKRSEDVIITRVHDEGHTYDSPKRLKFDNNYSHNNYRGGSMERSLESLSSTNDYELSSLINTTKSSFQMCGGEVKLLDKKEERMRRFMSSGGCIIPISECGDAESSPKMIRTPLLSGGSFTEMNPKSTIKDGLNVPSSTPKMMIPVTPLTPSLPAPNMLTAGLPLASHFQFPPINSITAFNPLTLPPVSLTSVMPTSVMHGDKMIPFVPGIPGPNTLAPPSQLALPIQKTTDLLLSRNLSPSRKKTPSPLIQSTAIIGNIQHESSSGYGRHSQSPRLQLQKPIIRIESESPTNTQHNTTEYVQRSSQRSPRSWASSSSSIEPKKSFNFTRMADNLSPRKSVTEKIVKSPEREIKHFNFENLITKAEIVITPPQPMAPLHVDCTTSVNVSAPNKEPTENEIAEARSKAKSKFLRPTSLPLKPGTFTPKRHHGITPTANTLPLISPETPRPSKACIQLYLNGHAYTYLGLKCSTKMFYCTVNCPQPSYIANLHKLSMYSVWQTCAENNPHPLGLKPKHVMSLYDSRQKSFLYSMSAMKSVQTTVHSQSTVMTPFENNTGQFYHHHQIKSISLSSETSSKGEGSQKSYQGSSIIGGYESNEDYTYIRGRGKGRYVCSECGIRCKKPSMLTKHIRTHTDVRPYTCKHCSFSFKTKGNLTKHMQSKTHYKKCLELGINPRQTQIDDDCGDTDCDFDQYSTTSCGGRTSSVPGESDLDDFSDGGDGETESSDTDESKSRLPEHEAARCLLSLSMTPPNASVSPHSFQSRTSLYQQQPSQFGENQSSSSCSEQQSHAQRRVISFTSPKPPFDYQKQEQYYSNPSIIPKSRDEKFDETSMKPIDLTKPRHVEQYKISDIMGDFGSECGFLRSLVSNTDKVRNNTQPPICQNNSRIDENLHLQAYLTEQALQYTKIKQSQMNKTSLVMSTSSTGVLSSSTVDSYVGKQGNNGNSISKIRPNDLVNDFISFPKSNISTKTNDFITQTKSDTFNVTSVISTVTSCVSSVETLSDTMESEKVSDNRTPDSNLLLPSTESSISDIINSKLTKTSVQIFSSQSQDSIKDMNHSPIPSKTQATSSSSGNGGAKSVASEYLKMTSAKKKSRTNKPAESEESSSDQEISNSDGGNSTNLEPPSDFTGILARTVIVGEDGFKKNTNDVPPRFPRVPLTDDSRPICKICSKTFQKQHQMVLHMNIHYMERPFKCEPCAVSFRTQGHLQKHERSEAHKNKVTMTSTFGVPTTLNPRPFECSDCKVAFRIHGHLAKHLRSKTHVQKLECLQKLPFGTYAEIERAGISLTEIDTTDCDNSLASLKVLAQKLIEKDPNKLNSYTTPSCIESSHESGSEDSPDTQLDSVDTIGTDYQILNTPGMGIKRKYESFSSSSDDSIMNPNHSQQQQQQQPLDVELRLEKKVKLRVAVRVFSNPETKKN